MPVRRTLHTNHLAKIHQYTIDVVHTRLVVEQQLAMFTLPLYAGWVIICHGAWDTWVGQNSERYQWLDMHQALCKGMLTHKTKHACAVGLHPCCMCCCICSAQQPWQVPTHQPQRHQISQGRPASTPLQVLPTVSLHPVLPINVIAAICATFMIV